MQPQPQFQQHPQIPGLFLYLNFITNQQQKDLVQNLKKQEWNTSLKRRTQHYGYQYSYDRKSVATKTINLPQWCLFVKNRIQQAIHKQTKNKGNEQHKQVVFDQMIVNQYEPGQGINPHIDNINLFKDYVVSVSLGSNSIMVFEKDNKKIQVSLMRCSAVVLSGQARFQWKHSIPSRKSDHGTQRGIRYSLTFRQMKT